MTMWEMVLLGADIVTISVGMATMLYMGYVVFSVIKQEAKRRGWTWLDWHNAWEDD